MSGEPGKTQIIRSLCEIPKGNRDSGWQDTFCKTVGEAGLASGTPQILRGPDGFSYFQLELPEQGKESQSCVIYQMKADLLRGGNGVVINAGKGEPDWVFSYGDIVNYYVSGEFYTVSDNWNLPAKEVIDEKEEVLMGQPSESFLPSLARKVLSEFLTEVGVTGAKLLIMGRQRPEGIAQELVFNLTPDRFPTPADFENIMRRISWFMPRHYRYVCMQESGMEEHFVQL